MEELRKKRHLKEPDQLASGKSDEDGNMVIEELTPNDEIDVERDELKDSHNDWCKKNQNTDGGRKAIYGTSKWSRAEYIIC